MKLGHLKELPARSPASATRKPSAETMEIINELNKLKDGALVELQDLDKKLTTIYATLRRHTKSGLLHGTVMHRSGRLFFKKAALSEPSEEELAKPADEEILEAVRS